MSVTKTQINFVSVIVAHSLSIPVKDFLHGLIHLSAGNLWDTITLTDKKKTICTVSQNNQTKHFDRITVKITERFRDNRAKTSITQSDRQKIIDCDRSEDHFYICLLYTSPSPRDRQKSRMPSSA